MQGRELKRLAVDAGSRAAVASRSLAAAAGRAGLLDVAVADTDSPLGRLLVAVTRRGLVRVAFAEERRDDVLEELAARISPRVLESPEATDAVRRQLDEYFAGVRERFELTVDMGLITGFAQPTLRATKRVPYGTVTTYSQVAQRIGSPRAARAVGNALGSNPIPIVVPCHRVLRSGGALGGYGGGIQRKQALLKLEGVLPQ
jgi:methylated-DNA-[protein]-cysteine S-methyltransferase